MSFSACSNSGKDGNAQGTDNEASSSSVLISGGSCVENDVFIEDNGAVQNFENTPDFFDCSSPTITEITTPSLSDTGTGTVTFNNADISIDAAAVEVFLDTDYENHSGIQLYLHDGEVRIVEQRFQFTNDESESVSNHKVNWGIYNGSFVLSVELASATTEGFASGTFEFIDIEDFNDPSIVGMNTIFRATVFQDKNDSGEIDATDEISNIVSGNLNITGERPNWSVSFDMSFDSGQSMSGFFNGDYVEIPLADLISLQ